MTNLIERDSFTPEKVLRVTKKYIEILGKWNNTEDAILMLFLTNENLYCKILDRLYKYNRKSSFYPGNKNPQVFLLEEIKSLYKLMHKDRKVEPNYYFIDDYWDRCINDKEYYWNFSSGINNDEVDITSKSSIEKALSNGVWQVTFTKVDGSTRRMVCTRDFDYISVTSKNWVTPKGIRAPNPNIITVWDLEKNEWRSFRINSIKYMNKLSNNIDEIESIREVTPTEIKDKLGNGIWKIMFRTIAGGLYETIGTRDWDLIKLVRNDNSPGTNKRVIPDSQIIYWDLNANNYRSFRASSLIKLTKMNENKFEIINPNIKMTKKEFGELLYNNVMEVTFIKRDGSTRIMICTSNFDIIKKIYPNEWYEYDGNRYNHLYLVWDLEKMDYRNIRYDSIISYKILNKL